MDEALYAAHAALEDSYWWFVGKNRIILDLVDRFAPPPAGARPRACDIGCGAGGVLARLAERFEAVGIEPHAASADRCRSRGLRVVEAAFPDCVGPEPLEPGSFEVVVMSEVLEHLDNDRAAAAAAVGLLQPGGVLIVTVPAHPWLWSGHDELNHHRRRYTRRALADVFQGQGVHQLALSYANAAMFAPIAAARLARRGGRTPTGSAIRTLPRPVNAVLTAVFSAESPLIARGLVPIGTSLVGVYQRAG